MNYHASRITGRCSEFAMPNDPGMLKDTGLAFFEPWEADARPDLFIAAPANVPTWRRLRSMAFFCALRIAPGMPRNVYQNMMFTVYRQGELQGGISGHLVDRGPGRMDKLIDLSTGMMAALSLETGDLVEVELAPAGLNALLSWKL